MMHWLSDFGGASSLHCALVGACAWVVMSGALRIIGIFDRGSLTGRQVQRRLVIVGILGIIWLTTPRVAEVVVIIGALMMTGWIARRFRNLLRSTTLAPHRPRFFADGCGGSPPGIARCCESRGRAHWADMPVMVQGVSAERCGCRRV